MTKKILYTPSMFTNSKPLVLKMLDPKQHTLVTEAYTQLLEEQRLCMLKVEDGRFSRCVVLERQSGERSVWDFYARNPKDSLPKREGISDFKGLVMEDLTDDEMKTLISDLIEDSFLPLATHNNDGKRQDGSSCWKNPDEISNFNHGHGGLEQVIAEYPDIPVRLESKSLKRKRLIQNSPSKNAKTEVILFEGLPIIKDANDRTKIPIPPFMAVSSDSFCTACKKVGVIFHYNTLRDRYYTNHLCRVCDAPIWCPTNNGFVPSALCLHSENCSDSLEECQSGSWNY